MTRSPIARLRDGLIGSLALLTLLTTLPGAATATPSPSPSPAAGQVRVEGIARRLLLAGTALCPEQRRDFGLVTAPASLTSWGAPITRVWPGGPAEAAGLRAGDRVRAVNGVPWSADAAERQRFAAALAQAPQAAEVTLEIERGGLRRGVTLAGQPRCHAEVRLSPQPFVNATAVEATIVIGGGLERLLRDDAELAFAIAHEAAHILLGHTAAERRAAIATRADRLALETEADAFAVRLMAAAGYPASAAPAAWLKIADAGRPPLIRLMDLHGPYMTTPQRSAFLTAEAARTVAPPLLALRRAR